MAVSKRNFAFYPVSDLYGSIFTHDSQKARGNLLRLRSVSAVVAGNKIVGQNTTEVVGKRYQGSVMGEDSLLERVTAAGAATGPTAIKSGRPSKASSSKPCQQKGQGSPMKPPPAAVATAASLVCGLQTMTVIR